ncbi:MAG: type II secretion system protein GspD, partial [Candidatus Thiodiazotropha taylori]|nr:type II secretion system protein GspD [Candidatus Thiodiazotropha taylori]MCW4233792.1 type II secretion system protein GspD [Candidatus Thiodiazotropha taylori]
MNFATITPSHAEQITLNLNNADIEALIKTVSEHTGKNFVIDPRVKGKVTVISAHPMDRNEFYEVFLSILEVHGFSTIPSGDVIK